MLPACVNEASELSASEPRMSVPATVSPGSVSAAVGRTVSVNTLASPQSMTCTSPKLPTITLPGLRSR